MEKPKISFEEYEKIFIKFEVFETKKSAEKYLSRKVLNICYIIGLCLLPFGGAGIPLIIAAAGTDVFLILYDSFNR